MEVSSESKFVVLDSGFGSAQVITSNDPNKIYFQLGFGALTPDIRIVPEQCRFGMISIDVTFRIILGNFCGFLLTPTEAVSTSIIPIRTVLSGKAVSTISDTLEGVKLKVWANRMGNCTRNTTLETNQTCNCDEFSSFDQCTEDCCQWNESPTSALSGCLADSEVEAEVVYITDTDGSFTVQWPELFVSRNEDSMYNLHVLLQKDGYHSLRVDLSNVLPGARTTLLDFTMLEKSVNNELRVSVLCCTSWMFVVQKSSQNLELQKQTVQQLGDELLYPNSSHGAYLSVYHRTTVIDETPKNSVSELATGLDSILYFNGGKC